MKWIPIGILLAIVALGFAADKIHDGRTRRAKRRLRKGYAKKRALTKDGR